MIQMLFIFLRLLTAVITRKPAAILLLTTQFLSNKEVSMENAEFSSLPKSESARDQVFLLPLFPGIGMESLRYISTVAQDIMRLD